MAYTRLSGTWYNECPNVFVALLPLTTVYSNRLCMFKFLPVIRWNCPCLSLSPPAATPCGRINYVPLLNSLVVTSLLYWLNAESAFATHVVKALRTEAILKKI